MRSIIALEGWATTGPTTRRILTWLLFWPLLLALRLPASSGSKSVSDWLRVGQMLGQAPAARERRLQS